MHVMQRQNGKWRLRALLGLVVCAGLSGACQGSGGASTTSMPDVWATVDGREIRRADIEKIYQGTLQPGQAPSDDEALAMKLGVLDDYINQDILVAKATSLKIAASDADVNT